MFFRIDLYDKKGKLTWASWAAEFILTSQVSHENDVFPPTFDVCDDFPLTTTTSFWVSELSEEASDSLASSEDDESWLISIFEDELSPPEVEAEQEADAEEERDEDKEDSMVEESSNLMMMLLPLLLATAAETVSLTSFFLHPSEISLYNE